MNRHPIHQTHPEIVRRLRRAEGHLRSIIDMIEAHGRVSISLSNCRRSRWLSHRPRRH